MGVYIQYMRGITSVQWKDNIGIVEGIQYSGGKVLLSACLAIKNDEKISICFMYYETKFLFGSFENSSRFHAFLEIICFEIIDNFIFGMLYLSFKFNCRCDCK